MSALNGFSPLPPLFAQMSPLIRSTSFDWNVVVLSQSAASAALEQPIQQQPGDLLADIDTAQAAAAPHLDPAPMAQAKEEPQAEKVKEEPIDGGTARSRSVRKKRKQASPPPPSSDEDSAPKTKLDRNRESALKYRQSKKLYLTKLETENESLKQKVKSLTKLLNASQHEVAKLTQRVIDLTGALKQQ